MNQETANTILDDIVFMASSDGDTTRDVLLSINGYLLALSRHKVITSEEQREIGNTVLKAMRKAIGEDAE